MATSAISSAASQAQQILQPRQQQPQRLDMMKAADEDSKAKLAQAQQSQPMEQLRPVLNEKGQSTGNVINTTA